MRVRARSLQLLWTLAGVFASLPAPPQSYARQSFRRRSALCGGPQPVTFRVRSAPTVGCGRWTNAMLAQTPMVPLDRIAQVARNAAAGRTSWPGANAPQIPHALPKRRGLTRSGPKERVVEKSRACAPTAAATGNEATLPLATIPDGTGRAGSAGTGSLNKTEPANLANPASAGAIAGKKRCTGASAEHGEGL